MQTKVKVNIKFRFAEDSFNENDLFLLNTYLNVKSTYNDIISLLINERLLPPIGPLLDYKVVARFDSSTNHMKYGRPAAIVFELEEGQTLEKFMYDCVEVHLLGITITSEVKASTPPKKKLNNTSSNLDTTISTIAAIAGNVLVYTASSATIIQTLIVVQDWWRKNHSTQSTNPNTISSLITDSNIVAIRLQMTDGTEAIFEEWLTDPDRLRHYIDVFHQPSASVKPLQVIFVLKQNKRIIVDVSEGAQQNIQLNEVLNYLKH